MCNNCNQNNCTDCTQEVHICNQCPPTEPCDCAVKDLSTDCSVFTGDSIECDSVVVVAKNTILSDALANIVSWSCTKFSAVENFFRIINTGNGVNIFSGVSLLGEKKLRRLKSTNGSVIITQGTDDIDFSVPAGVIPDGTETKIVNGTNTTVTGTGTIATPYVINSTDTNTTYSAGTAISLVGTTFNNTAPDQTVVLTQGGATTITGTYPNFTISSTNTIADGSETKLTAGTNITITGNGTIATPYVISSVDTNTTYLAGAGLVLSGTTFNIENLQKVITYPADFSGTNYTLTNADNNYEIIIDNGATAVTITVPSGLTSKIGVGFTQKGSGDVSYTASGTTINNPTGLKIKGQFHQTYLSQELSTNNYFLGGSTKI